MSALTTSAQTALLKALFQAVNLTAPTALYFGLITATKGYWTASTAYSVGDTILPATPNGHLYKCTTAGTSGASAPTWPTGSGATVTDGTAVWTEQDAALDGMTSAATVSEVTGAGYARVAYAPSSANYPLAAVGSDEKVSNNSQINFGSPGANWGVIFAFFIADAASGAGNVWVWVPLTQPKTVNNGDPAPFIAASAFGLTMDN